MEVPTLSQDRLEQVLDLPVIQLRDALLEFSQGLLTGQVEAVGGLLG